uniref:Polymerase PB2 n=1 Tax=Blattella germanica orthomyxovirus 1 TaxID=3133491 RepID=A0AAT9J9Q7_9ORTO
MDERKKIFLHCIRSINNVSDRALTILRTNKISNMRMIERNSKSLKDPNPITSTMVCMASKYPITVDKTKCDKYKIPSRFMHERDEDIIADTRKHDRVLCKKEAIDWWIDNAEVPKEGLLGVINTLYKEPREQVRLYLKIDWSKTELRFGPPVIERRLVPTRDVPHFIPHNLREPLLKEILFPELTLPDSRITGDLIGKMKEIVDTGIQSRLSLPRQIRILLNHMDPKLRTLPVLPGMSNKTLSLKHAIIHNNLIVHGVEVDGATPTDASMKVLKKLGDCLIYLAQKKKINWDDLRLVVRSSKINGNPIITLLESAPLANQYIWMKAIMGMSSELELTFKQMKLCPHLTNKIIKVKRVNQSKFSYMSFGGVETYNFKFGDNKGSFTRNEDYLVDISVNITCERDLTQLLAIIASFIWHQGRGTVGKTNNEVRAEIFANTIRNPWDFIGCTSVQYKELTRNPRDGSIGRLTCDSNTEYRTTGKYKLALDEDMNIQIVGSPQKIVIPPINKHPGELPDVFECPYNIILDHLSFKKLVEKRVRFYIKEHQYLKEKVLERDFKWKNEYMVKFTGVYGRSVSVTCRGLLTAMALNGSWNKEMCSFMYLFSNPDPMFTTECNFQVTIAGYHLDFTGTKGIMYFDNSLKRYKLFNRTLDVASEELDIEKMMSGVLPGYRILDWDGKDRRISTIKDLQCGQFDMKSGEMRSVYIGGKRFDAVRDEYVRYQVLDTYNQRIGEVLEQRRQFHGQDAGSRRLWDNLSEGSSDGVPAKKLKLDDIMFGSGCVDDSILSADDFDSGDDSD